MLNFVLRSYDFLGWEWMAGRAIPRTFPSDESSFFTDAGQFALALFCKYSVASSSSRVSEFHNSSLYIIFHFYLFIYFWPCSAACGILVPWPGIEPAPSAVKARSPNHWTTRELLHLFILLSSLNVCVYMYMCVRVCMLLMLLKLFQLDSHSSVIFICNTKVIKHFWALISSCARGKESSLYPIVCRSRNWMLWE